MRRFRILVLCSMLLLMAFLPSCGKSQKTEATTETKTDTEKTKKNEKYDEVTLEGMAEDVLKQMSLEEKIGQLFIVCTDSLDFYAETSITDAMKTNLDKYQPGGVIFYSFNIDTPDQTKAFIEAMQAEMKIPMFIAVDEEGGQVARIGNNEKMGTTSFPSMKEIGETKDKTRARDVGETIGKEISALGFNLDFAPVADVMTNSQNTEIGDRSFGEDPELVASMVAQVVKGLQSSEVCATLKHFPGQGSSGDDTHKGYVNLDATIDDLRKTDFLPFEKGIKAGADFVMVSHVSAKNITGNDVPSSLSKVIISEILRDELEYENIVITDAMNMKSITKFYDSDEAAVKAFQAGNDIILMPDDFSLAVEGIRDAVDEGEIDADDINQAVLRILKVKIKRGILSKDSQYFR